MSDPVVLSQPDIRVAEDDENNEPAKNTRRGLHSGSKKDIYMLAPPDTEDDGSSRASTPSSFVTPRDPGIFTAGLAQPAQPAYPQGAPHQTVTWNKATNGVVISQQPPPGIANNQDVVWTEDPTPAFCPKCQHCVLSNTYHQTGSCTYVTCVVMIIVGCDLGCCFIPFFMDRFKDVLHSCPKCRTHLGLYTRL